MSSDPSRAARIQLTLYVAGKHPVEGLVREHISQFEDDISFEVVDVRQNPERAERDNVIVTPSLLKVEPLPRKWVMGLEDLSALDRVLQGSGAKRRLPFEVRFSHHAAAMRNELSSTAREQLTLFLAELRRNPLTGEPSPPPGEVRRGVDHPAFALEFTVDRDQRVVTIEAVRARTAAR